MSSLSPFKRKILKIYNSLTFKPKVQKEIKIRDFENFDRISLFELDSIEYLYLQKLYMIYPKVKKKEDAILSSIQVANFVSLFNKNTSCLLYRLQKLHTSYFDGTEYTKTMIEIFRDSYQLPNFIRRFDADDKLIILSKNPYDDLFVWSLLLYGGSEKDFKLIRHFWSKTKFPIAGCMIAMIIYEDLCSRNFIPEDLKEKMTQIIKY